MKRHGNLRLPFMCRPRTRRKPIARVVHGSLVVTAAVVFSQIGFIGEARAGPQGGEVTAGRGQIKKPDANTTVIQQQSHALSINWQTFDVGRNELVQFNQPSSSSSVLNRVLSERPSEIFGRIVANGRVYISNGAGVIFGKTASVKVGSLFATSLDITPEDFAAGRYNFFSGDGTPGPVINRGLIRAATGGFVALLGGSVKNEGVILANVGHVKLVSGTAATVDFDGDGLIRFKVDGKLLEKAKNAGDDSDEGGRDPAGGGTIELSAEDAKEIFTDAVNSEGIAKAGKVEKKNGKVVLADAGAEQNRDAAGANKTSGEDDDAKGPGGSVRTNGAVTVSASGGDGVEGRVVFDKDGKRLTVQNGNGNGNRSDDGDDDGGKAEKTVARIDLDEKTSRLVIRKDDADSKAGGHDDGAGEPSRRGEIVLAAASPKQHGDDDSSHSPPGASAGGSGGATPPPVFEAPDDGGPSDNDAGGSGTGAPPVEVPGNGNGNGLGNGDASGGAPGDGSGETPGDASGGSAGSPSEGSSSGSSDDSSGGSSGGSAGSPSEGSSSGSSNDSSGHSSDGSAGNSPDGSSGGSSGGSPGETSGGSVSGGSSGDSSHDSSDDSSNDASRDDAPGGSGGATPPPVFEAPDDGGPSDNDTGGSGSGVPPVEVPGNGNGLGNGDASGGTPGDASDGSAGSPSEGSSSGSSDDSSGDSSGGFAGSPPDGSSGGSSSGPSGGSSGVTSGGPSGNSSGGGSGGSSDDSPGDSSGGSSGDSSGGFSDESSGNSPGGSSWDPWGDSSDDSSGGSSRDNDASSGEPGWIPPPVFEVPPGSGDSSPGNASGGFGSAEPPPLFEIPASGSGGSSGDGSSAGGSSGGSTGGSSGGGVSGGSSGGSTGSGSSGGSSGGNSSGDLTGESTGGFSGGSRPPPSSNDGGSEDSGDTLVVSEFLTQDALWQLIQTALLDTLAELGLLDSGLFLLPDAYAMPDSAVKPTALRDPDFPAERRPVDPEDDEAWHDFYMDVVYEFLRERHGADDIASDELRRVAHASIARQLARTIAYYERVRARESALRARKERQQKMILDFTASAVGTPKSVVGADAAASPETKPDAGRSGYVGQEWSEGGIGVEATWWPKLGG